MHKDEGVNFKMPKKNHSYKTYDLHYLSVTTAALLLDPILADPTFIGIIPIRPTFSKARVICKSLSGFRYERYIFGKKRKFIFNIRTQ